jgi:DNA-binding NtrC family response regulator
MKHKANILIVDDEEVVRLSHLRSLAGANYHTEAARSGYEALAVMQQRQPDLVFLDLRMPEMDGMSLLKIIRQQWPNCEVVVVTGYPTVETAKEALKLGAYHYLVKPVAPNDVVRTAEEALNYKGWALRAEDSSDENAPESEKPSWPNEFPYAGTRPGPTRH